jgi:putative transposase
MQVTQAYRFALDPTPRQAKALSSHVGAARFAFNWGLAVVKDRLDQGANGASVEVPWTLAALRREWNRTKHMVAPWWADNSKEAYASGLDALARALADWTNSKNGRRAGPRIGFPRFRKRGRSRETCRFTTGPLRVEHDRHHVTLPRLGRIRTHESTRKLARHLERGTARILSATVSHQANRWFVSFTVLIDRALPQYSSKPSVVGVDAGVKHLAVVAAPRRPPWFVDNPRPLAHHQRRLRRAQRTLARRRPGSHGREQARQRLGRLHLHIPSVSAFGEAGRAPNH